MLIGVGVVLAFAIVAGVFAATEATHRARCEAAVLDPDSVDLEFFEGCLSKYM
jgi:hypothetical protein